ncbi:serine hydrolase [Marinicrinis lubricantis]|uniref:Serine hydrolase n=1 Tax=Marinicrinis lubricantis TaxID=2086470 RepID=A0ABW1IP14_9BACL
MKSLRKHAYLRAAMSFLLAFTLIFSTAVQTFASESEQAPAETTTKELTAESAAAFLDEFFNSEEAKAMYAGASVAIVKDDQIITQQGYGFANVENQTAVDPANTIFRMASVSKTFAAVAIMQLVEQGKIDLNEDIRTYLPESLDFENPFDTPVTVAHLLTHESGFEIRDPMPDDVHNDFELFVSMEDYAKQYMPPVVREPGTSYMYDNFAYLLAGIIVQEVSGEPFEQYMENHVFQPIGMHSSDFDPNNVNQDQLAVGYDAAKQPVENYVFKPTIMPQGGMYATAEDIAQFMIAFLNDGANETGRVLSADSVSEMGVFRSDIHPILPNATYGFESAMQIPLAGHPEEIIVKYGDVPGNSSMLMFIPEQNVGIFLTYTQASTLREVLYAQFIQTFYPEYAAPVELGEYASTSTEQLKALEGIYSDLRLASIVSKVGVNEQGQLTISDAYLGLRALKQVDSNLFIDEIAQRFTAFTVDEKNGVVYMKEPYLNPLGYAIKGEDPAGFTDIDASHPYASYILPLQSLGHYSNEAGQAFQPENAVTRAELAYYLVTTSGLKGSATEQYAFTDIADHPLASYIQMAYEIGIIKGDGKGQFYPDREVTRQEAAVMVWSVYQTMYPDTLFADAKLTGEVDSWAAPAVKMAVTLGYFGPEVTFTEDGAANFQAKKVMTRQEEAAFLHQLLFQPSDQIVAQLMAQQQQSQAEAAPAEEPAAEAAPVQ